MSRFSRLTLAASVLAALSAIAIPQGAAMAGPTTTPAAPTAARGVGTGDEGTQVDWTTPADDGGAVIIGYQVRARLADTHTWFTAATSESCDATDVGCIAEPSTMISQGIIKYRTYTFAVRAYNSNGWGPWSQPSSPYAANPYGRPRPKPPTHLSVTTAAHAILVRWQAPGDTTGYPLGYIVNWRAAGTHWNNASVSYTRATEVRISGLRGARTWYVRVRTMRTELELSRTAQLGPLHLRSLK